MLETFDVKYMVSDNIRVVLTLDNNDYELNTLFIIDYNEPEREWSCTAGNLNDPDLLKLTEHNSDLRDILINFNTVKTCQIFNDTNIDQAIINLINLSYKYLIKVS